MKTKAICGVAAVHKAIRNGELLSVNERGARLRNFSAVVDVTERRFGSNMGKLPVLRGEYFDTGVPVFAMTVKPVSNTFPPPECHKMHLCTPDPDGDAI